MKEPFFPLRRGVSPETLLLQVKNTAPFIFGPQAAGAPPYIQRLNAYAGEELDHQDYFQLCLCAHWATAGTYVPTDVDNAIRENLWKMEPDTEKLKRMAEMTLEAGQWDYTPVTARLAVAPPASSGPGARISTHEGTWFSVAVGAYAALREACPAKAEEVAHAIMTEAEREVNVFKTIHADSDGLELLRACALLAHNFGDLDRVADMWRLPQADPLYRQVYNAASPASPLFAGWLAYAGRLNQKHMAPENHRHYALREARCLRRRAEFLLPVGPFFDGWGQGLAGSLKRNGEDLSEIVQALLNGWERLKGPVGYARALTGIIETFPGGLAKLSAFLPAKDARTLKSGPLRALCSIPRPRFEAQWASYWKRDQP